MRIRAMATTLVCIVAFTALAAQARKPGASHAETYESATIDADGQLVIVKANRQRVVVRKDMDQTTFSSPAVSSAKTAVAADAMFGNCCTSYDIPLQLVVYAGGRVHRFKGVGLPIFQWGFADEGTRIAYGQEPVHFGCAIHYELRDIASERLIDQIDVPEPCGEIPDPKPVKVPVWVTRLTSNK